MSRKEQEILGELSILSRILEGRKKELEPVRWASGEYDLGHPEGW